MFDVKGTAVLLNANNAPASSLADAATSTRILSSTGALVTPNAFSYPVFGFSVTAPNHSEPAYLIMQNGQPYYLLVRNCFFTLA